MVELCSEETAASVDEVCSVDVVCAEDVCEGVAWVGTELCEADVMSDEPSTCEEEPSTELCSSVVEEDMSKTSCEDVYPLKFLLSYQA